VQASVPELAAARLSVQSIDIGQLSAGPISVGRLVLDDLSVDVSTGAAAFRALRVTVDLAMSLEWRVQVKVPVVGSWDWDGTIDLGAHSCTVEIGDLSLPGLAAFTLDLAGLTVDGVAVQVAPLQGLTLGPLVADVLAVSDVLAPTGGFTLSGLGIGRLAIDGAGLPGLTASSATAGHVTGQGLPLGDVTLGPFSLPQADVDDIMGTGLDAAGTSAPYLFTCDVGVLDVTLRVTPGARLQADELRLSGVRTSASVGSLLLHDVQLPYDLLDLRLTQLGVETIELPKIEVG